MKIREISEKQENIEINGWKVFLSLRNENSFTN